MRWVLTVLLVCGGLALHALWLPLVLASWGAALARPLHAKLNRSLRGSNRAAAVVTVTAVLLILTPLALLGAAVLDSAAGLLDELRQSGGLTSALQTLSARGSTVPMRADPQAWIDMFKDHGGDAMSAAGSVLGAVATSGINSVVFVYSFYTFMVHGRDAYLWFLDHSPFPPRHVDRLATSFQEIGRALVFGLGGTALVQATIACISYAIIGVPQPLLFGVLTGLCSLIPIAGTGLVWAPMTGVLFFMGATAKAMAVLGTGALVASLDNVLRPALARHGQLHLPMYLVFIAMLGGLAGFGAGGILLGPLFIGLLLEGLRIGRASAGHEPAPILDASERPLADSTPGAGAS